VRSKPHVEVKDTQWARLERFVDSIAKGQTPTRLYFLKQTFRAAIKLARESPGTLNLKIAATTLKELRYSFKLFYHYRYIPKITLFGSARIPPKHPAYEQAKSFSKMAVSRNYMIITGGGPGVMQAGNEGAGPKSSFGLNIRLPMEQQANPFIDPDNHLIHYKYFYTRKLFLIKEASALVLFPGGFGTFDEAFELLTLLQTGKTELIPVVFLEPPEMAFWREFWDFIGNHLIKNNFISPNDTSLFKVMNSAEEALDYIDGFYKNYHSIRLVKDKMVIRIQNKPSPEGMLQMEKEYGHLSKDARFRLSAPLPEEANEPELSHLPRIVFPSDKNDYSGMRLLIDFINQSL